MADGLVTVMVPSYNYAQYLTECVESAVQPRADVVIVDNGSTDGSPEIAEDLARRHEQVRFVRHEDNAGIITSFNRCRAEIRGSYAVLLCADDCLTPGSLERAAAFMDAHPQVGLVYGQYRDFARLDEITIDDLPADGDEHVIHDGAAWIDRLCRTGGVNPVRTPEALMRSSVLDAVGLYEPACPFTSDLNNWLRMASVSDVGFLPGTVQGLFRRHESNRGKAFPFASSAELDQRWMAFDRFFDGLGSDRRRAAWEAVARREIAASARYAASRAYVSPDLGVAESEALLALAAGIDPSTSSGEDIGWALRRRLGPGASRWFPGFLVRPLYLRALNRRRERRRVATGLR